MASVRVAGLKKAYGKAQALSGLSFGLADGEFFCLLGPPGAGKTTTLRLIAGLEKPDQGEIWLGEDSMHDVHPMHRDVAMVFEDVALYPHWTAFDNLAHPLKLRKVSRAEIEKQVHEVSELLHIGHLLERRPGTFSGGERRRVAIGRALVRRPRVLLLDQPLTDLDAKIRQEMSGELKRLQDETRQTMIYATHDFEEAMAMADRIMVVNQGQEEQTGTPREVYEQPGTAFVGSFIGSPAMNLIRCSITEQDGDTIVRHQAFSVNLGKLAGEPLPNEIVLGSRPEHMLLKVKPEQGDIPARVDIVQVLGDEQIVDLSLSDGTVLKLVSRHKGEIKPGDRLNVAFAPSQILLFDVEAGKRIALTVR